MFNNTCPRVTTKNVGEKEKKLTCRILFPIITMYYKCAFIIHTRLNAYSFIRTKGLSYYSTWELGISNAKYKLCVKSLLAILLLVFYAIL